MFAHSDALEQQAEQRKRDARSRREAEEEAHQRRVQQERDIRALAELEQQAAADMKKRAAPAAPSSPDAASTPLGIVAAGRQKVKLQREAESASPAARSAESRALPPQSGHSPASAGDAAGREPSPSRLPAPSSSPGATADQDDPRVLHVLGKAQQLSSRFTTLLQRLSGQEQMVGSNSGDEEDSLLRHMTVAAALQASPLQQASNVTPNSSAPAQFMDSATQHALVNLQHALHDEAVAQREAAVQAEIVPATHLQPPYELVQPESRLEASRRASIPGSADSAAAPASTPSWAASVLLPASIMQPPFPTGFHHAPLPDGQSVSSHALLYAEHTPDAAEWLTAVAAATGADSSAAQASAAHLRSTTARPYYDLATREYESLQERVRIQKARYHMLATGQQP